MTEAPHAEAVTLEFIAGMLGDVRAAQLGLKQQFEEAVDAAKLRDQKVQGELRALRGSVDVLAGKADIQAGLISSLTASVEELEVHLGKSIRKFSEIDQALEGLVHLGSTNFDQNASILEALTGSKGADRPKRQSKPGSEPE